MKKILFLLFLPLILLAQDISNKLIGSAYTEFSSYGFLQHICDNFGGRNMGSDNNYKALEYLKEDLASKGIDVRYEYFNASCYFRGNESVTLEKPFIRRLKAASFGFMPTTKELKSEVVWGNYGLESDLLNVELKDKILLLNSTPPTGKDIPTRFEMNNRLASKGVKGILYLNDSPNYSNLVATGNFRGLISKIPAFSITFEESSILKRLIDNNVKPVVILKNDSYTKEMKVQNAIYTIPGKVKEKIVIGGHFDSWDIGQGAIDNGLGLALLHSIVRIMNKYSNNNYYTVEFVWFNGEEYGLMGSRAYYEKHKNDNIVFMINLDMVGKPTGFDVMGFDSIKTILKPILDKLGGYDFPKGIVNQPYLNTDHMYFMINGIPCINPITYIDEFKTSYYHDYTDTFEKVNKRYLSDAAAIMSVILYELANRKDLENLKLSPERTKSMLQKYNLENQLKKQGDWNY